MIQRKVDQLSAADRQLLMVASVQGPEFDSAVVAQVLDREAAEVEERLEVLERVHVLVRRIREEKFPDGTLTLRYGFVHALYQNALYAALQPTRKAAWSAAAARSLINHHGENVSTLATELALLFEAAHDQKNAAFHYLIAAENAARIFAHHEAVALARRGLEQLETLPDTPDRARRELPLQVILGVQLQVVHGYAAPEAERTYLRAAITLRSGHKHSVALRRTLGSVDVLRGRLQTQEIAGTGRAAPRLGPKRSGHGPGPPSPYGHGSHVLQHRRPTGNMLPCNERCCTVRPETTQQPHAYLWAGSESRVLSVRVRRPLAPRTPRPGDRAQPRVARLE